jgi:hypothetical protein
MKRFSLLVFLFFAVVGGYGQLPDLVIVDENGNPLTGELTIIAGMSIRLGTNFNQLIGQQVSFEQLDRTSEEGPFNFNSDFLFRFYDEFPTQFNIGSNGYITFENPPWNPSVELVDIPFSPTTTEVPRSSIFGCFKRWNPVGGDYVSYHSGVWEEMFVMTWCNVPAQITNSIPEQAIPTGTFQIVLHEDGTIEIHLIEIQASGFAGDRAAVGIQSDLSAGSTGEAPDERNWTDSWNYPVQNESYRFTPAGDFTSYSVEAVDFNDRIKIPEYIVWYELDDFGDPIEIGQELRISISPQKTTTYRVELRACWDDIIATEEITINVAGTFPTAFNPYSAAPNNEFKMILQAGLPIDDFRLQVYNRWGQIVFETTDYELGWNGQMNNSGTDCPAGVYNWVIILETDSKSRVTNTGSVMLIR